MAKLEDKGIIGEKTDKVLNMVYAPFKVAAVVPGMAPFFNWYIFHLWQCDNDGDLSM